MEATSDDAGGISLGLVLGVASAVVLSLSVVVLLYRKSGDVSVVAGRAATTSPPPPKLKASSSRLSLEQPDKPRVRVLYGTQTGTAERFSKQLGAELRKKYGDAQLAVEMVDLENYRPHDQLPREKLVVLCVATYGDGEPTDNAADFFAWLSGAQQDAAASATLLKARPWLNTILQKAQLGVAIACCILIGSMCVCSTTHPPLCNPQPAGRVVRGVWAGKQAV
jgi:hypothetical protein